LRASIISESEVSISVLCLLCSLCYTAVWIKNCSKSTSVIKVATIKKIRWCRVPQWSSKTEVSITFLCQLHSIRYTAVRIKKCLKSTSVYKSSHYEKYGWFLITQRKPSRATTKLTFFTVSEDEWNTKEDTGKSLKNALQVLWYAKRHLLGWSNVKQWKNQAFSCNRWRVMLD